MGQMVRTQTGRYGQTVVTRRNLVSNSAPILFKAKLVLCTFKVF